MNPSESRSKDCDNTRRQQTKKGQNVVSACDGDVVLTPKATVKADMPDFAFVPLSTDLRNCALRKSPAEQRPNIHSARPHCSSVRRPNWLADHNARRPAFGVGPFRMLQVLLIVAQTDFRNASACESLGSAYPKLASMEWLGDAPTVQDSDTEIVVTLRIAGQGDEPIIINGRSG